MNNHSLSSFIQSYAEKIWKPNELTIGGRVYGEELGHTTRDITYKSTTSSQKANKIAVDIFSESTQKKLEDISLIERHATHIAKLDTILSVVAEDMDFTEGINFDVQKAKDGQIILTFKGDGREEQLSLQQLQARFPRVSEKDFLAKKIEKLVHKIFDPKGKQASSSSTSKTNPPSNSNQSTIEALQRELAQAMEEKEQFLQKLSELHRKKTDPDLQENQTEIESIDSLIQITKEDLTKLENGIREGEELLEKLKITHREIKKPEERESSFSKTVNKEELDQKDESEETMARKLRELEESEAARKREGENKREALNTALKIFSEGIAKKIEDFKEAGNACIKSTIENQMKKIYQTAKKKLNILEIPPGEISSLLAQKLPNEWKHIGFEEINGAYWERKDGQGNRIVDLDKMLHDAEDNVLLDVYEALRGMNAVQNLPLPDETSKEARLQEIYLSLWEQMVAKGKISWAATPPSPQKFLQELLHDFSQKETSKWKGFLHTHSKKARKTGPNSREKVALDQKWINRMEQLWKKEEDSPAYPERSHQKIFEQCARAESIKENTDLAHTYLGMGTNTRFISNHQVEMGYPLIDQERKFPLNFTRKKEEAPWEVKIGFQEWTVDPSLFLHYPKLKIPSDMEDQIIPLRQKGGANQGSLLLFHEGEFCQLRPDDMGAKLEIMYASEKMKEALRGKGILSEKSVGEKLPECLQKEKGDGGYCEVFIHEKNSILNKCQQQLSSSSSLSKEEHGRLQEFCPTVAKATDISEQELKQILNQKDSFDFADSKSMDLLAKRISRLHGGAVLKKQEAEGEVYQAMQTAKVLPEQFASLRRQFYGGKLALSHPITQAFVRLHYAEKWERQSSDFLYRLNQFNASKTKPEGERKILAQQLNTLLNALPKSLTLDSLDFSVMAYEKDTGLLLHEDQRKRIKDGLQALHDSHVESKEISSDTHFTIEEVKGGKKQRVLTVNASTGSGKTTAIMMPSVQNELMSGRGPVLVMAPQNTLFELKQKLALLQQNSGVGKAMHTSFFTLLKEKSVEECTSRTTEWLKKLQNAKDLAVLCSAEDYQELKSTIDHLSQRERSEEERTLLGKLRELSTHLETRMKMGVFDEYDALSLPQGKTQEAHLAAARVGHLRRGLKKRIDLSATGNPKSAALHADLLKKFARAEVEVLEEERESGIQNFVQKHGKGPFILVDTAAQFYCESKSETVRKFLKTTQEKGLHKMAYYDLHTDEQGRREKRLYLLEGADSQPRLLPSDEIAQLYHSQASEGISYYLTQEDAIGSDVPQTARHHVFTTGIDDPCFHLQKTGRGRKLHEGQPVTHLVKSENEQSEFIPTIVSKLDKRLELETTAREQARTYSQLTYLRNQYEEIIRRDFPTVQPIFPEIGADDLKNSRAYQKKLLSTARDSLTSDSSESFGREKQGEIKKRLFDAMNPLLERLRSLSNSLKETSIRSILVAHLKKDSERGLADTTLKTRFLEFLENLPKTISGLQERLSSYEGFIYSIQWLSRLLPPEGETENFSNKLKEIFGDIQDMQKQEASRKSSEKRIQTCLRQLKSLNP